jgi:TRAP-type mannitol/chloroaromatic compound transport system permease large subunit
MLRQVMLQTTNLTCMVFIILCGAAAFGLVFRGLGGDTWCGNTSVHLAETHGSYVVLAIVMGVIFFIGLFPRFHRNYLYPCAGSGPIMLEFGFDPVWFCILLAVNLQTSFMTPPFGFSCFISRRSHRLRLPPAIFTGALFPLCSFS